MGDSVCLMRNADARTVCSRQETFNMRHDLATFHSQQLRCLWSETLIVGTRFLTILDESNELRPNLSRFGEIFYSATKPHLVQYPILMTLPGIRFGVVDFL